MTDLELTMACAWAMGHDIELLMEGTPQAHWYSTGSGPGEYDPLHDNAQAMALVKRFTLQLEYLEPDWNVYWRADWVESDGGGAPKSVVTEDTNLNRAICLTIAQMQRNKS